MTLEPRSKSAIVVPTALFCVSLPIAMSAIDAKRCPAATQYCNKLNNVASGPLNGKN